MASIINKLHSMGLIKPPHFVIGGMQYETIMGSEAYGVATDFSDKDVYGFVIPPKEIVFPHLNGHIEGFGKQVQRFEQYQEHHIKTETVEYDLNIYNIVKYFQLCMENNPNMIDSLFTDTRYVLHSTKIAQEVRDNRKIFLHKGCWHKFKGYSYSQLSKMKVKKPEEGSKRYDSIKKFGYDIKFGYHVVRLINEVEQILSIGDLDLTQNNRQLISIRNGEWSLEQIEEWFYSKEKSLEELYNKSMLPYGPDEERIKNLLFNCLEEYYGSLENCVEHEDKYKLAIYQMKEFLNKIN